MSKFQCISVPTAQQVLSQDNVLLLDCRDLNAYRAGHVSDALHVHDDLVKKLIKDGDKNQALVIYCYHGHSSQHLAELFSNFGFESVYSVDGGYEGWKAFL